MSHILRSIQRAVPVAIVLLAVVVPVSMYHPAGASLGVEPANRIGNSDEPPIDQIIVKYKASADVTGQNAPSQNNRLDALSAAAGTRLTYFRAMSGDAHVLRLPNKMPVAEVSLIAKRLRASPDVEYAEPDRILQHTLTPNDPQYPSQWHYYQTFGINAPAAWDVTTGSSSIVVAVIDTGITNHADLSGRTVPGYDFITDPATANDGNGRDSDPSDPGDWITPAESASGFFAGCRVTDSSWHGTHVAGTIGAKSNNGAGVAGINWNSKILPVRVLGKCGGTTSDIADAIRWAAGVHVTGVPDNLNPAKAINMSLGGPGTCDATTQSAIDAATSAGTAVIVAAGNNNANASGFTPASCSGVITVAATNRNGNRASYSNYGSVVEISAPGGETNVSSSNGVLSTLNAGTTVPAGDAYAYYQGTSMATPHVVGVASLVLSVSPSLTPTRLLQILQSTVTPFPGGSTCNTSNCGSGIVNAGAAVNAVLPQIASLNPPWVVFGSGSFSLTVNGIYNLNYIQAGQCLRFGYGYVDP